MIADIYLNDISDELWSAKVGCNQWIDNHTATKSFTGTFDGDGYVVYGIYFNYETTPKNTYVGLFQIQAVQQLLKMSVYRTLI